MRGSTGTQPFDYYGRRRWTEDPRHRRPHGFHDFNTSLTPSSVRRPTAGFRAPLRWRVSVVYINGKIVVFGGEATGRIFTQAYDPDR
jgi:hypothetical protein